MQMTAGHQQPRRASPNLPLLMEAGPSFRSISAKGLYRGHYASTMIRCLDTPAGSRIPQPSYDPTMYGRPRPRRKWRGNGYSLSWFHHVTDTGLVVKAAKGIASHSPSFGGVPDRGLETALVVAPTGRSDEMRQQQRSVTSFRRLRSTALNCIGRVDNGINSGGWRAFEEAKEYARSLGFESELEWRELLKREEQGLLPPDIPSNPDKVYKDKGWWSWPDFLGYQAVFWYDFDKVRNYVWILNLKSQEEWQEWSLKSGERPPEIPSNPAQFYKDEGWLSWGDFLGFNKGYVAGEWRDFEEAREHVWILGLKSRDEWRAWSKSEKRPPDIPTAPDQVYKGEGWLSWGDFLGFNKGYEYVAVEWRDFEEARNHVWSLGLKSQEEWQEWSKSKKKPPDIPSAPDQVYKGEGWLSWGDFLGFNKGYEYVAVEWRDFEEARDCVWSLGLKSQDEWTEWSKSEMRPPDIPSAPDKVYKGEGWLSWGDFLGYNKGYVAGEWRDFEEAREHVWILGLKSQDEWKEWSKTKKRPPDIPKAPDTVYKGEGWLSWGDFLGFNKGYVAGEWRDFEEAREHVWSLGLKSKEEWKELSKSGERPPDVPSDPDRVYKGEGWLSWGDFLGYNKGYVAGEWRDFEEARNCVWILGLKSWDEWQEWSKSEERPHDIPSNPDQFYKGEGWLSWGDFLGYNKGKVAGEWRDFEEARDCVWSLGLKSHDEWKEWSKSQKKPHDIPSRPDSVYKGEGWLSWGDFLGYRPGHIGGKRKATKKHSFS